MIAVFGLSRDALPKAIRPIAIAEGVLAGESVRLVEKLADMIAERLFTRFANLLEAEVEVAKLGVDIGYDFGGISVKIRRKRGDYIK